MALFNKVGSILKQSISQSSASSMLNSVRFMSTRLFVGGLSYETGDDSLRDAFSQFGEVADAKVIMDRNTGSSRGFAFVNFTDSESANSAVSGMNGQDLQGRTISVKIAEERAPGPRGGGYGGGRGGYGGGGGYERNSNDGF